MPEDEERGALGVPRPIVVSDHLGIVQLAGLGLATFGSYGEPIAGWLQREDVAGLVLVADDGSPAAFVLFAFTSERKVREAYLLAIVTHDLHRRRGLARHLLTSTWPSFDTPQGPAHVDLHVAGSNEEARALFESEGFRALAGPELRYPNGEVAVTMRRPRGGRSALPTSPGAPRFGGAR